MIKFTNIVNGIIEVSAAQCQMANGIIVIKFPSRVIMIISIRWYRVYTQRTIDTNSSITSRDHQNNHNHNT